MLLLASSVQYNRIICTGLNKNSKYFILSSSASHSHIYKLKYIIFYYKLCSLHLSFMLQLKYDTDFLGEIVCVR